MRPTISELMLATNCEKWPERWNEIYDHEMDYYEKFGCELADPTHYDKLEAKYDMFEELLDDYKLAASEIAKDDNFCRLLALVAACIRDRGNVKEDLKVFSPPKTPDGSLNIKYDMFSSLVMCEMVDYTYGILTARKLPREHVLYGMRCNNGMIRTFKARNNGAPGSMSWTWYQLSVDAKLFGIGRLQMEMFAKFTSKAVVFANADGENVALANEARFHRDGMSLGSRNYTDEEGAWDAFIEETDDAWTGYPYTESGFAKKEKITLKKSEWTKVLEPADPVVSVHIPPGGGMTDELVSESFAQTKAFIDEYFPDFKYKGFICGSWLMDPQLVDLLGEKTNIAKFCKRFKPICVKSAAQGIFSFVFLKYHTSNVNIEELPEGTTLERKVKQHYLDGKAIYEMIGYIPKDKI